MTTVLYISAAIGVIIAFSVIYLVAKELFQFSKQGHFENSTHTSKKKTGIENKPGSPTKSKYSVKVNKPKNNSVFSTTLKKQNKKKIDMKLKEAENDPNKVRAKAEAEAEMAY